MQHAVQERAALQQLGEGVGGEDHFQGARLAVHVGETQLPRELLAERREQRLRLAAPVGRWMSIWVERVWRSSSRRR